MSGDVVAAILSGLLVLSGVALSQFFELKKRRSEEKRWYADYFLPKKFDAISNLYAELQTVYGLISVYQHRRLKDEDEYQSLIVKEVNNFNHIYHLASIYLPPACDKSVSKLIRPLAEAGLYIGSKIKPLIYVEDDGTEKTVIVDWPSELDANYNDAKNKVAKILTPSFLKELEKK